MFNSNRRLKLGDRTLVYIVPLVGYGETYEITDAYIGMSSMNCNLNNGFF
ncbi:hypothetical protein HMPREF0083_01709 [Aneurinibacillus aneurinilyticus ATCC 12856]|uniref:Uncharacterized protein n=1 Tax=Aneurinibacillus aneurinilyticus ATCC 12856 TaxID=649747 RepID=U1X6P0_ANEAE|nr:hypothetical protein HMPREF0083_01709 [Aneurinibacillus aneurinilyticus ATCC 12856]